MFQEFFIEYIVPALLSVIGAVLIYLSGIAAKAIRSAKNHFDAEWAHDLMESLAQATETAVQSVNQTFADGVREETQDGKLTIADASVAFQRAMRVAKGQLGEEGLKALSRLLGGTAQVEAAIADGIEASVSKVKTVKKAATDESALLAIRDMLARE